MDNKDKEELLPCPFCGGKAVYLTQNNSYYIHVAICCKQCECQTSYYKSKDKAIAAWNRRNNNDRDNQIRNKKYNRL